MEVRHYIAGTWQVGEGAEIVDRSPWDLSELVRFRAPSPDQIAAAAQAAADAQAEWGALSPVQRGKVIARLARALDARRDEWACLISREMGKFEAEARDEVVRAIAFLEWVAQAAPNVLEGRYGFSELATRQVLLYRRPVGPALLIVPWNFPANIASWKLGSALACGCTAVLKPSGLTPLVAVLLVECVQEAGFPPGVVNLLAGDGATGAALADREEFRAISFTGSTAVGKRLARQAVDKGQRIQAEMGGVNTVVVMADAPIDKAVSDLVASAFGTSGQRCTAPRMILVEQPIHERFASAFVAQAAQYQIAPLASEETVDNALKGIKQSGLEVLVGGKRTGPTTMLPTVLAGTVNEEIFGPAVAIAPVADLTEALAEIHRLRYGLSSAIYTSSLAAAFRFLRETDTGMVHINKPTTGGEPHLPFGGLKDSGIGPQEMGTAIVEFFTEPVTAYIDHDIGCKQEAG